MPTTPLPSHAAPDAARIHEVASDHLGYDRSRLQVGIVHFGFGNFHRAHQASYLDALFQQHPEQDWAICGVGILPSDAAMRDAMSAQDCLFTVVQRHPDGRREPRIVGSVVEYLFAAHQPQPVLARLEDPAVRIVSLTVTEGGYLRSPATGRFDPMHGDVIHDAHHPETPVTAFGYIVEGLRRRRACGVPPFTVMSCDNLQGNSRAAKEAILGIAQLADPDLAAWIDATVAFPNGMVDRITPVTTDADRQALLDDFGLIDAWPVPCEPFTQWILEDHFPTGRPNLEAVGVQFVADVEPYEFMKLRLLNASHQVLAYLGAQQGYELVDEAMRDGAIRDALEAYMHTEARPTLGDLPGIDVDAYIAMIMARFANPQIRDTLVRLATDSTSRMMTFVLPVITENLRAGRSIEIGATAVAAWAEYWAAIGRGDVPSARIPHDLHHETLVRAALDADPDAFARESTLVGELSRDPHFIDLVRGQRGALQRDGMPATVTRLLGSSVGRSVDPEDRVSAEQ